MLLKEEKMVKVLVLGGSGFVSESLATYLINRGYDIDILTRGLRKVNYSGYKDHIICDRKNKEALKNALSNKKYDVIFDISAYSKDDVEILFSCINPSSLKRYIFCSSAAVYIPSAENIKEDANKGENSTWGSYGYNKLQAEHYINELIKNKGLHATIFRPSYIYGEGNDLYRECFFFDKIKNDEVILVPEDDVKVQFIHIQDLVKAFECAIYNDNDNRSYNLTSPDLYSWDEVIKSCTSILNKEAKIKKIPLSNSEVRSYFPFRSTNFNLNIMDLRENGFHLPVIYLKEGLEMSYKWYLDKKPFYQDSKLVKAL